MAHANKAVVLVLMLFFFVYTSWHLYCLPCLFLCSVTVFLKCIHFKKTNQVRLLCTVGLINLICKASRHAQRALYSQFAQTPYNACFILNCLHN